MTDTADVVVIGAGQAGLATSHELTALGVEHVVLERRLVGETWRGRWDSFCLVTPNWTVSLPGQPYDGAEPDGFMSRDEIVSYLERYARFLPAVQQGIEVRSLEARPDGGFRLKTSHETMDARTVVVATGAYQRPHRPPAAATLPRQLRVLDAEQYRNPTALPPGAVLVIGSGQTGCQIAEELCLAGREVYLSCGRAPWMPRRLAGRDIYRWVADTGFSEMLASELPTPAARLRANPQATGRDGGHDLHYRTLQALGVHLMGRFVGAEGAHVHFAPDLAASVAFGDARYLDFCQLIRDYCARTGQRLPDLPAPPPFAADPPNAVELSRLAALIFTSGFRPDYTRWIKLPAFDELGFPMQTDGASSAAPGIYFVGVHFLRKRKSSLLLGVGEDASIVAEQIATATQRVSSLPSGRQSALQ